MRLYAAVLITVFRLAGGELAPGAGLIEQSIRSGQARKSFEYEADINVAMTARERPLQISMHTKAVGRPPGRIRVLSTSAMGDVLITSDGASIWTYISSLNQYTRRNIKEGEFNSLRNFGFRDANDAKTAISRARTLRSDQIPFSGSLHDCWVVEIPIERLPLPVPAGSEMRNGTMQVWLDRNDLSILRMDTSGTMHGPSLPGAVEVKQTMTLTTLRFDRPVDDSVFTFQPPATAVEVPELGKPSGSELPVR